MEFITEINASNEDYKPTIAIDFDGVLHLDNKKDAMNDTESFDGKTTE